MNIVRDGNDYEPQTISQWRLRELIQIEKDSQALRREHLAFVAVMNALDVHMPPDGAKLLHELRQIAETAGYPWGGAEPPRPETP